MFRRRIMSGDGLLDSDDKACKTTHRKLKDHGAKEVLQPTETCIFLDLEDSPGPHHHYECDIEPDTAQLARLSMEAALTNYTNPRSSECPSH